MIQRDLQAKRPKESWVVSYFCVAAVVAASKDKAASGSRGSILADRLQILIRERK
jgi:hypothetical protein